MSFVKVEEIARRQNGRITAGQLRACGFGNSSIENGVRKGLLHRVHVGVYAFGHLAPNRLGDWHGAVLACVSEAWLSHRCAATAFRIRDGVGPLIDVTVRSGGRARPGLHIHRSDLQSWEVGTWERIPITSPNRTMVDLAHVLKEPDAIAWALRELQFRHLYDRKLLELSLRRRPNKVLNRLLDDLPKVQSPLELAFFTRVVRRYHLPEPECQAKLHGFRVDFLWPEASLVVEVDGKNHDLPMMRLADAARDEILTAAGYTVLRFRWADVHRHASRTAAVVIAGLHPG